ncbi:MAG: carbohydrate kinase [Paludibacter sp.]|nr:carbohydrate kinase [Paludibacter sp.]
MKNTQEKTQNHSLTNSPLGAGGQNVIVGIGEILWDVFPKGKVLGGAPANFAYHVSQFGFEGYAVSAIGNDDLGHEIIENLSKKDLKYQIETTPFETGTVQVTLDEKGIPQYEICENVAWDNIPFTPEMEALARKTQTVCFGSLAQRSSVSRSAINRFLDCVPETALKIFDINLRQHFYTLELIEHALDRCNILKINDDEILIVGKLFGWESKSELEICNQLLHNCDLEIVVLTKGTQGSYVVTRNETSFKPTPLVEVADTVGAGDSFTAAFVSALLRSQGIGDAHQLAVDVSAFVCTQHGAMPLLPEKLLSRVKKLV